MVKEFEVVPCKYIKDVERGSRYANRIVEVICAGEIGRLQPCAETSFVSYFAAPKEEVLQAQLAELPQQMHAEHRVLTQLDIEQIKPKHIICMGWRSFDRFLKQYGDGSEIITIKLTLMGEMVPYYAYTNASQLRLTGIFFGIFLWFTLNHPRARSLSAFRNDKQFSFL